MARRPRGVDAVLAAILLISLLGAVAASHQQWISVESHVADAIDVLPLDDSDHTALLRPHRRLATTSTSPSPLSLFRSLDKRGLRGFLEGGQFPSSMPDACAQRCVADPFCLSFDLETSTQTCYISYADRYARPEAFLEFPTGVYYEWQGVVAAPTFEPDGGRFNTQPAVRLLAAKLGATIHYQVVRTNASALAARDLVGANKSYAVAVSGDVVVLPPFACRIYAVAIKDGMQDSAVVVSNDYRIYAAKYMFLIPSFNGAFHGLVTRIQLDIRGKKRPRPARFHEFSDYETYLGMGPYATQVATIDMAKLHASFAGFQGGFSAFSKAAFLNETFLTPAADDKNYMVTSWRVVLAEQYTPHPQRTSAAPVPLSLDAEYLYLTPFFNGAMYMGQVLRVLTMTFDWAAPVIQQLDLTAIDPTLTGFVASFTDDAAFAYFVPQQNARGLHGKFVRLALDDFSPSGVRVLDLERLDPRFVGFSSGFKYRDYAYLVPFRRPRVGDERATNLREFPVTSSGVVVRVDLRDFATVESLDLAKIHPRLAGFSGAVRVTHYAYFVPFQRVLEPASAELNPYSGLVARLDLRDFSSVALLDLAALDDELRGFVRGFAYKQYVVLVPHRSSFTHPRRLVHSGKVVRIDTTDFTPRGVAVLDLTAALRSQVPDYADRELRGFSGGAVSGKYGFFVPYFNGRVFAGNVCRINLDKFDEVQTLQLTQHSDALRGFAGAVLSKTEAPLETDLFGAFEIRPGTTTPYKYIY